jgi:hypothetical protein
MTDRIENQQGAERTEDNSVSNMLKETLSSPKAWSGLQKNDTASGAYSKQNPNLPDVEIAAYGVIVAPGNPDKEVIKGMVEAAIDRVNDMLDRLHEAKPGHPRKPGEGSYGGGSFQISDDMLERFKDAKPTRLEEPKVMNAYGGSEGSIGRGEKFVVKPENQVTEEMIENFKKAKPAPMPRIELDQLPKAPITDGFGTIQKPKN